MWNNKGHFYLERVTGELFSNKNLDFAFVDFQKAFDRVPRDVVWWALRKIAIEEWLVKIVQLMYRNTQSCVIVNGTFIVDFLVQVGLHRGTVLSPLLFFMVLEVLSREIRSGCSEELLSANGMVS